MEIWMSASRKIDVEGKMKAVVSVLSITSSWYMISKL